jgi:hypothetical protein
MDEIISKFEKLSTEVSVDDLIMQISKIDIKDPKLEWDQLQKNYLRLKHFKQIYSNIDIKYYESIFKKPFLKFMEKIDEINQYYIKNINLDSESYTNNSGHNIYDLSSIKDIINIIGSSLDKSMNSNDPTKKLDYVLIAYSNIILLIDDFNGENCVKLNNSADTEFYQNKLKKRRF